MSEHSSVGGVRLVSLFIIFLLSSMIYSPKVLAESEWEEDGWLKTSLAQERLNKGDEFGCYGMQGLSWQNDPGAVALECREYIEDRLIANRWGDNPISTFTPDSLTQTQHEQISRQGFMVHGDNTGAQSSAWHSVSDKPLDMWDWYNLGRRGGSLEQIVGSKEQVETAVNEGGLVNLYWIGRVNDATIRHDRDIEEYISEDAEAWLTTWGQAWSYWATTRCYQIDHSISSVGENYVLSFESLITEECTNLIPARWNLPVTWIIDINQSEVLSIAAESGILDDITGERHTKEGYMIDDGQYLHLSIVNGNRANITIEQNEYDIRGISEFWNNHSAAITIAAHETTDLFKWSKRFVDQDDLVFTWLVQPRPLDGESNWIPYVAFSVGVGVIITMLLVLKREGLGPLAKKDEQ
tara:strand:+ start:12038 stop:13267 length:1230 start_codon:yes stop_codon:yes gene_type:complete